MMEWLTLHVFNELNLWVAIAIVAGFACLALAFYIPPLRSLFLAVGTAILAAAAFYSKGARDQRELEKKKRDTVVKKINKKYDEIDARKTTPDDVERRLKDGNF